MRSIIFSTFLCSLLVATATGANAQAKQDGKFCLKQDRGASNCSFATMAACEKAKAGNGDQCAPNPSQTTGSGMSAPATAPSNSMKK